jgi:predicted nucleic acid-binding protein
MPNASAPISTHSSIKIQRRVPRHQRGVLDTSVIIAIASIEPGELPAEASVTAVSLAELTAGPLSTKDASERARRLERLQWVENTFEAIPFDVAAARAYGRIYAAALAAAQKPRGAGAFDLLIAATALSRGLPLYTRNAADFSALTDLMEILAV